MHYTALHCSPLHCTVLYYTVLHCITLHCTIGLFQREQGNAFMQQLLYPGDALQCTALSCTGLNWTELKCTSMQCTVQCLRTQCPALTFIHCVASLTTHVTGLPVSCLPVRTCLHLLTSGHKKSLTDMIEGPTVAGTVLKQSNH